jgi:hypothetical protein
VQPDSTIAAISTTKTVISTDTLFEFIGIHLSLLSKLLLSNRKLLS